MNTVRVGRLPNAASTCLGLAIAPHDVHGSYGGVHVSRMAEGGDNHTVAEQRKAAGRMSWVPSLASPHFAFSPSFPRPPQAPPTRAPKGYLMKA